MVIFHDVLAFSLSSVLSYWMFELAFGGFVSVGHVVGSRIAEKLNDINDLFIDL